METERVKEMWSLKLFFWAVFRWTAKFTMWKSSCRLP